MIRTLHLIDGLGSGGAERSLAELLPDLPSLGIQPTVAIFHRRSDGVEESVREAGIPILHVPGAAWNDRIRSTRALLREIRPDLLHTTLFDADVIGRIAALGTPTKVLTSLVNTSYEPVRLHDPRIRRSGLLAAQFLDAATARLGTQHFHAITDAVRQSAIRRLKIPPERISVVPRGRRRSRLGEPGAQRRAQVRRRLNVPLDARVLLHVGREEHQKGHAVLLEAAAPILLERPDVVLMLAGRRGNTSPAIDTAVANLPTGSVRRLGHVNDVPDLLAASDVFVFPSLYEGLGGAALEAMAMAVPIIASDLPALREILDGVALFVDVNSPRSLTTRISEILNRPGEASTRASAGRQRFDNTYEHSHVVAAMASMFRLAAQATDWHEPDRRPLRRHGEE